MKIILPPRFGRCAVLDCAETESELSPLRLCWRDKLNCISKLLKVGLLVFAIGCASEAWGEQVLYRATNLRGAGGSAQYFSFNVPRGVDRIVATFSGSFGAFGTGEALVKLGQYPTTADLTGNVSSSVTVQVQPGTYYGMLYGYTDYGGVNLTITGYGPGQTYLDYAREVYAYYAYYGQTNLAYAYYYYWTGIGYYMDYLAQGNAAAATGSYYHYLSYFYFYYFGEAGFLASSYYYFQYHQALSAFYFYSYDAALATYYYNLNVYYADSYYQYFSSLGYF